MREHSNTNSTNDILLYIQKHNKHTKRNDRNFNFPNSKHFVLPYIPRKPRLSEGNSIQETRTHNKILQHMRHLLRLYVCHPLFSVQGMYRRPGSPLPLDWQMHRKKDEEELLRVCCFYVCSYSLPVLGPAFQ